MIRKYYKGFHTVLLLILFQSGLLAQDDLDLRKMILPADSSHMFLSDSFYIWGGSVIKGEDHKYHMFYERWMHADKPLDDDSLNYIFNGFSGWLKYSEIAHAVADNINGPYKFVNVVLRGSRKDGDWKRFTLGNPMITQFDGKFYLYFIANSLDTFYQHTGTSSLELKQWYRYNCTQKIGVAVADKLEDFDKGKFQISDQPIMEPDGVKMLEITNNPTVCKGPDGQFYMMFKSRSTPRGHMTMWMAKAERPDGPFKVIGNVFSEADFSAEDPSMWYDNKRKRFYAILKNYSNSGKLNSQFGSIALVTSEDGLKWKPAMNSMVSLKEINWKDGRKIPLARLERPFLYITEKGEPAALFAAFCLHTPSKENLRKVGMEYNSGNISILLQQR